MSEAYLGEIRMFGGNFAPLGWALCWGQTLSIAQYDALYTLLGTTYGGDGQNTFNLPDLRGRVPVHAGQRQGSSTYVLGQTGGVETVTLVTNQIPAHTHTMLASTATAAQANATGNVLGASAQALLYYVAPANLPMAAQAGPTGGGGTPHDNMQPYLCVNYIIALEGIFPSQN